MNSDTYNGWTNYETWQASLWLGDAQCYSSDSEELEEMIHILADTEAKSGLYMDIFNSWIYCVNFHEIAENNVEVLK